MAAPSSPNPSVMNSPGKFTSPTSPPSKPPTPSASKPTASSSSTPTTRTCCYRGHPAISSLKTTSPTPPPARPASNAASAPKSTPSSTTVISGTGGPPRSSLPSPRPSNRARNSPTNPAATSRTRKTITRELPSSSVLPRRPSPPTPRFHGVTAQPATPKTPVVAGSWRPPPASSLWVTPPKPFPIRSSPAP